MRVCILGRVDENLPEGDTVAFMVHLMEATLFSGTSGSTTS